LEFDYSPVKVGAQPPLDRINGASHAKLMFIGIRCLGDNGTRAGGTTWQAPKANITCER
jgi:hypothetical protein